MKREEILKKSIEKAVENGFELNFSQRGMLTELKTTIKSIEKYPYEILLFNHRFAKAFWGEDRICVLEYEGSCNQQWECKECMDELDRYLAWEYHIAELAKSEDRLEYIKKFI
jgi:hypothetical protein